MDPISLAGLGFGAVSLTFQLFSGCVKGKISRTGSFISGG